MNFPIFKTKIEGVNQRFNLADPRERQKYLELKAGLEIKKLKEKLSTQTLDNSLVKKTIKKVLADNQKAIIDYHSGKNTAMQFLLGQCLRVLGRQVVIEEIRKELTKQLVNKK